MPFVSDDVLRESLELANVVKLNDEELPLIASVCNLMGDEATQLEQLAARFDLRGIALTKGAQGSVLWSRDQTSAIEGIPTKVVDTVGAGDAFTAAFTLGLLRGFRLDRINRLASQLAAFVCAQSGATPTISADFLSDFADA